MKKILFLFLITALFANCNHQKAEFRITIVTKAMDSEFWQKIKQGAVETAKDYPNVELNVLAPLREINIDQQVNILEDQILKNVSAIAVAPCGVSEILPALDKANEKGIPVITVDTDIDWPHKKSYVGTDNKLGGELAGEFLAKKLNGKGNIALIRGIPGIQTHEDRVAGFMQVIKEYPDLKLVASQPANSERDLALTVMENILTSNPNLDGVFMTSDQMALGALEAIAARNSLDKIVSVGFDAGHEAVMAVKEKKLTAVVAQSPYNMGKMAFLTALKIAQKQPVDPRIDTGTELITIDNVEKFLTE